MAYSSCASTLPLATKRSSRPSLLTSANWACQAVDGSASPPVNGRCAVTPSSRAMSSYVGCAGPSASVCSLLSPWLVRYTSG